MISDPPSLPSAGLYAVPVRLISASADADAAGADPDAWLDVAGVDGDAVLGEGLAAPWHAANTTIVVASKPTRRFRIKTPPTECVSPHCWSQTAARSWPASLRRHPRPGTAGRAGRSEGTRVHTVSVR